MKKLHKRLGIPMEANDWTIEDWADLHAAISRAIKKIAKRHKEEKHPAKEAGEE